MKHLLILLISITSVNYLFGDSQWDACLYGYNARGMLQDPDTHLYRRGIINLTTIKSIKSKYGNVNDRNAALWGYHYAGCSEQNKDGKYVYFGDSGYAVADLNQRNNGYYGWYIQPGCYPEATQGDGSVCSVISSPN